MTDLSIKPKRGRKSKKDLLIALNINSEEDNVKIQINEIQEIKTIINQSDELNDLDKDTNLNNVKPESKKRGRKPKGGKIIEQITPANNKINNKPNIILHLKCYVKDLNNDNSINDIKSYHFSANKDLNYELISDSIANINMNTNTTLFNDNEEVDDNDINDSTKDIWKKIKQLQHNLHINNTSDKKSACFWCTYDFDNPPIYIPNFFIKNSYNVYGCFCSPECATAYLMEENIDSSTKFERYHFINHVYAKIYNYTKNIKPAPNPYYMLDKYYGNLSIQEYRSLFKNERLFLIVDKPLTRILPELHEDNDDFILNNKIIPSNNYQLKTKIQRKTSNKISILNENFGIINS
jgi:hypothetical protein